MKDRTPIDYGNVPITKLPPGRALGADDMTNWSHRRSGGRSGVAKLEQKAAIIRCDKCETTADVLVEVHAEWKAARVKRQCCGINMRFVKFKRAGFKRKDED
jgi:hypothetical protein